MGVWSLGGYKRIWPGAKHVKACDAKTNTFSFFTPMKLHHELLNDLKRDITLPSLGGIGGRDSYNKKNRTYLVTGEDFNNTFYNKILCGYLVA